MSDIPELVRRHRKLIRCLHPWTILAIYPKENPVIAMLQAEDHSNRGLIYEKNEELNCTKLAQLINWKRQQWR